MTQQSYPITGTVRVDTESRTWHAEGTVTDSPPDPPPNHSGDDMIEFSQVVITRDSPDVKPWPIGAKLLSIGLSSTANAQVDFSKKNGANAWPFVQGSEGGEIQFTLWVACLINGVWWACASILCISRGVGDDYVPTGPTLEPGQLPNNWYYFCGDPLQEYQPQAGEMVAWFLTSGVQRRNDIHAITERTQIVLAPFSPGLHNF